MIFLHLSLLEKMADSLLTTAAIQLSVTGNEVGQSDRELKTVNEKGPARWPFFFWTQLFVAPLTVGLRARG